MKKLSLIHHQQEHREIVRAVWAILLEASKNNQPADIQVLAECKVDLGESPTGLTAKPGGGVRIVIDIGSIPEMTYDDLFRDVGELDEEDEHGQPV